MIRDAWWCRCFKSIIADTTKWLTTVPERSTKECCAWHYTGHQLCISGRAVLTTYLGPKVFTAAQVHRAGPLMKRARLKKQYQNSKIEDIIQKYLKIFRMHCEKLLGNGELQCPFSGLSNHNKNWRNLWCLNAVSSKSRNFRGLESLWKHCAKCLTLNEIDFILTNCDVS